MKTIVITSHGTLGDNLPLIALGQSLQKRGHKVVMVISQPMHSYALRAGLKVLANGRILGQEEALKEPDCWNHIAETKAANVIDESFYQKFQSDFPNRLSCLLDACKDADAIISTPQQNVPAVIARTEFRLPWIKAFVAPIFCCMEKKRNYKSFSDDLAYHNERMYEILEETLQAHGMSFFDLVVASERDNISKHSILGSSPLFSQLTSKHASTTQTGFWFYENPEWQSWQPDNELKAFMAQNPKPLVLSFSSQPLTEQDARTVVEVHIRAAAKLNRPILIQQGWADFKADLLSEDYDRDRVMFAGFMSQDWLFSNAAALIHHGGIGTTARALRNGCPMLVEPYGNDQFFNAKQIVFHQVGAAIHPLNLQVDELVRVLRDKVLTLEYKQRAEAMGAKIRQESGLENAVNAIEGWI